VTHAPRSRCRRAIASLLLALAGAGVLSVATALPASAHAVLEKSSPEDGSRLARAPSEVVLTFDEAVQLPPGGAQVVSTTGKRIDDGKAHLSIDDHSVVIPLVRSVVTGSYFATWRVVSADSHIVSGSIGFGVRQNPTTASGAPAAPADPLAAAAAASQGLIYLGLILLLGVPGVILALWRAALPSVRARRLAWAGWWLVLLGSIADLLLEGPQAAGTGWAGILRFSDLGPTAASAIGVAMIARVVLLLGGIPLLVRLLRPHKPPRSWLAATAIVAVAVCVSVALVGHAGTGGDLAVALTAATLHLLSMAGWVGGLIALLVVALPRISTIELRAGLRRWSYLAFVFVVLLIVSGEYQAWRQVQPLDSLWSTPYGITLLVKIGLVIAVLVVARVGHAIALTASSSDEPTMTRRLRRSLLVETVITIAVVVVTTVLVSLPPARTTYGPSATLSAPLESDTVSVHIDTTRHGTEHFRFEALTKGGTPARLRGLSATLSSVGEGIGSLPVTLHASKGSSAIWISYPTAVPVAGVWTITITATTIDGSAYVTSAEYTAW
jgi:copper transport protein